MKLLAVSTVVAVAAGQSQVQNQATFPYDPYGQMDPRLDNNGRPIDPTQVNQGQWNNQDQFNRPTNQFTSWNPYMPPAPQDTCRLDPYFCNQIKTIQADVCYTSDRRFNRRNQRNQQSQRRSQFRRQPTQLEVALCHVADVVSDQFCDRNWNWQGQWGNRGVNGGPGQRNPYFTRNRMGTMGPNQNQMQNQNQLANRRGNGFFDDDDDMPQPQVCNLDQRECSVARRVQRAICTAPRNMNRNPRNNRRNNGRNMNQWQRQPADVFDHDERARACYVVSHITEEFCDSDAFWGWNRNQFGNGRRQVNGGRGQDWRTVPQNRQNRRQNN